MKILNGEQLKNADNYTILYEPIKSIDLMERASYNCTTWILNKFRNQHEFIVFVGVGNNGGDGLAIARLLSEKKKKVRVFIVKFSAAFSNDFTINLNRLNKTTVLINEITSVEEIPKINESCIVIDAIFGSGLSREVSGIVKDTICRINQHTNTIVSIDLPSGLFVEDNRRNNREFIVKANYTLSFQFPKLAFLFAENFPYVGKWIIIDIGLQHKFINNICVSNYFIDPHDIKIKCRSKFSHKGNFGHALLIAGSLGKMGAAIFSSKSCLRSGAGLLTAYIPEKGNDIVQISVPEAMTICDKNSDIITEIPCLNNYTVVGIGPGLGRDEKTMRAIKKLIGNCKKPLVIDADALNLLSEEKQLYEHLPKKTILTPHVKEFDRLFGSSKTDYDRFVLQKEMSVKYQIIIVLKGAYTIISFPNGDSWFNSTGNPGMSTAGSGDVLTGIILAFLAQNYTPEDAAKFGVYIHGLAGDFALSNQSHESLLCSDIIDNLGNAFNFAKKIDS
jgi:ADP-dependent NAD(P)H-hydrate dehydratase / NAD(P)H-hydrate epimerase